jgi:hypothetical protein
VNILLGKQLGIAISSGNGQNTGVNTMFPNPVAAIVSPAASGVPVTFTIVPSGGASATFSGGSTTVTATTNGSGVATSPPFTANGTAGTFHITATVGFAAASNAAAVTTFTEISH